MTVRLSSALAKLLGTDDGVPEQVTIESVVEQPAHAAGLTPARQNSAVAAASRRIRPSLLSRSTASASAESASLLFFAELLPVRAISGAATKVPNAGFQMDR
nr:hypothetical protein [Stenotrophomonas terrae]